MRTGNRARARVIFSRVGAEIRARSPLLRQPVDFAAGEEEGPDAVDFRGVGGEFLRIGADGLHVGEFAVGSDAANEGGPGLAHGGGGGRAIEAAGVDAPREGLGVETGAAGFLQRKLARSSRLARQRPSGCWQVRTFAAISLNWVSKRPRDG